MKFGRLRYKKRIKKAIFYMLLIFGTIHLAVYPGSQSKYVQEEKEVLSYDAMLYYQQDLEIKLLGEPYTSVPPEKEYQSTSSDAYFEFSFERNDVLSNVSNEKYSLVIEPTNACTIEKVTSKASTIASDKSYVQYDSTESDTVNVIMKCDVSKITKKINELDHIQVSVQIKETIIGEDEFIYKAGTYMELLEDYYKKYPKPFEKLNWTNKTLTIPSTISEEFFEDLKNNLASINVDPNLLTYLPDDFNYTLSDENKSIYGIFKYIWLENIVGNYNGNGNSNEDYASYKESVLNYILSKYPDEESILNIDSNISLPGLKVSHILNDKGYYVHYFELEENLIGYARTDNDKTWSHKNNVMYFYTEDVEEIDKAFNTYFASYNYLGGLSDADKDLLLKYINGFDPNKKLGIAYLLGNVDNNVTYSGGAIKLNGKTIGGIYYYPEEKRVSLDITLLDHAYSYINKVVRVAPDDPHYMIYDIRTQILNIYGDIINAEELQALTTYETPVYNAIIECKEKANAQEEYSKYIEENNFSVHIYTDGSEYVYVTLDKLVTSSVEEISVEALSVEETDAVSKNELPIDDSKTVAIQEEKDENTSLKIEEDKILEVENTIDEEQIETSDVDLEQSSDSTSQSTYEVEVESPHDSITEVGSIVDQTLDNGVESISEITNNTH